MASRPDLDVRAMSTCPIALPLVLAVRGLLPESIMPMIARRG